MTGISSDDCEQIANGNYYVSETHLRLIHNDSCVGVENVVTDSDGHGTCLGSHCGSNNGKSRGALGKFFIFLLVSPPSPFPLPVSPPNVYSICPLSTLLFNGRLGSIVGHEGTSALLVRSCCLIWWLCSFPCAGCGAEEACLRVLSCQQQYCVSSALLPSIVSVTRNSCRLLGC